MVILSESYLFTLFITDRDSSKGRNIKEKVPSSSSIQNAIKNDVTLSGF